MSVWREGRAVPDREAGAALDRGLLLGDGLFETVLVAGGSPRHLPAHLARLRSSVDALGFPAPPELEGVLAEAVPRLWESEGSPPRAALRITFTRGTGRGLEPSPDGQPGLWILLGAIPDRPDGKPALPVRAAVVERPRVDPASPLAGHKTTSALHWVLARQEAQRLGADVALVRTLEGDLAEADAANLFAVRGGRVVTPPVSRGVLPGITRARAIEALQARGHPVSEGRVEVADLAAADEVFLTASLAGVTPVCTVADAAWPAPGPWACRLAGWLE